jgi:hypothetical protein
LKTPLFIVIGKSHVPLMGNTTLRAHHTLGNYDIDTITGATAQNPANPQQWGIRNESKDNWTYTSTDGSQTPVPPGRSAAIAKCAKIDFGLHTGEFK